MTSGKKVGTALEGPEEGSEDVSGVGSGKHIGEGSGKHTAELSKATGRPDRIGSRTSGRPDGTGLLRCPLAR